MSITISIDNDRSAAATGVQSLVIDESAGTQTNLTADQGDEIDVTLVGTTLGGLLPAFNNFLNGSMLGFGTLSSAQKLFAATIDGASSAADYIKVTTTNNESISNLFFSDGAGQPLAGVQVAGMHTLDGGNVYLWSNGDYAVATTSATLGAGRVVAAFYLNESADHLSGQIQMATFEALSHPDGSDFDDALNFTNALNVSATGTISFNFDNLNSGSFLWAAVGSSSAGLLVTGQDLNVYNTAGKLGNLVSGGGDPSDTVNTSQGGIGATIGINSQHFADVSGSGGTKLDGPVGVFTLVTGFVPLNNAAQATGINVNQIDYGSYINAPSAKIFLSQVTGSSSLGGAVRITLWEAGGSTLANPTGDHAAASLLPEEGYSGANSYIGNSDTDSHLRDDFAVNAASVTVTRGAGASAVTYTWTSANSGVPQSGITVTINGNTINASGLTTADTIGFAAVNDPNNPLDGTFNRFDVQALANSNAVDIGRIDLDQGVSVTQAVGGTLIVQDDGIAIAVNAVAQPPIQDDESFLGTNNHANFAADFTVTLGADGAGATPRSYALSTPGGDSGLIDTASGQHVYLFNVAGTIVGKAGADATAAASGPTVFVVSADQSGEVTLDQQRAIVHSNTNSFDEAQGLIGSNLIVLTATAYDGDGDHAAAPLDLTGLLSFKDDGIAIGPISDGLVDFAANATVSHTLNGAPGADPNAVPYTLTDFTAALTINGVSLLGLEAANNQSVTYWADTNGDGNLGNTGDTAYYRLTLGESGAGNYTFDVLVNPPPATQEFKFDALPSGQNLFGTVGTTASALIVIGATPVLNADGTFTNTSNTINTSQGGGAVTIGVNNQMFDPGEAAVFTYVKDPVPTYLSGVTGGLDQNEADNANNMQYTGGTSEVGTAFCKISQIQGNSLATMQISAFNVAGSPQGKDLALNHNGGPDPHVNITAVRVYNSAGVLLEDSSLPGAQNAAISITFNGGVAQVSGLAGGYKIEWDTNGPHDQVKITDVAGKFDIGGFGIIQNLNTPDQLLHFTATATDGDGDHQSASWSVGIDGTGIYHDHVVTGVAAASVFSASAFSPTAQTADSVMLDSSFTQLQHFDMLAL